MRENKKFIQGNEACVDGALYAGLDFFAGYPITPSTEIAELLSYRLPQSGGKGPTCAGSARRSRADERPSLPGDALSDLQRGRSALPARRQASRARLA